MIGKIWVDTSDYPAFIVDLGSGNPGSDDDGCIYQVEI